MVILATSSGRWVSDSRAMLSLVLGLVVVAWAALVWLWPMRFWAMKDDYVSVALAHALNLEATLRSGARYNDAGLWGHPGIPYYVVSWLSLRAATFLSGASDALAYALNQTEAFLLATRVAAGAIALAGTAVAWRVLSFLTPGRRALALATYFACGGQSYWYGLTFLGNETFALLLAALFFGALQQVAAKPSGRIAPWVLLGAVAGIGYTIKLPYLNLLAGAIVATLVDSRFQHARMGLSWALGVAVRLAAVAGGFVALAVPLLLLFLGRAGTEYLLDFHHKVITHSSMYGTGEPGPVSTAEVGRALLYLLAHPIIPLVTVGLFVLGGIVFMRGRTRDRAQLLWIAAGLTAMLVAAASVLKHFRPHYLVAISSLVPFMAAVVLPDLTAVAFRRAACTVLVLVGGSLVEAGVMFLDRARAVARMEDDLAAIRAMPLDPGDARLWTYNVASGHFAMGFVANSSGVPFLIAQEERRRPEISSYAKVERPYRYIVLDRYYYRDAQAVRDHRGPLDPTKAVSTELMPGDWLIELKTTIVVDRSGSHDRPGGPKPERRQ